jgi:GNAT superfamily N-acetyltransferase
MQVYDWSTDQYGHYALSHKRCSHMLMTAKEPQTLQQAKDMAEEWALSQPALPPAATVPLPLPETRTARDKVKPWMMTFPEYVRFVNPDGKFHGSDTYNSPAAKFKEFGYLKKSYFPKVIKRVGGIEYRIKTDVSQYCAYRDESDPFSELLRDEHGDPVYMTQAQMADKDLRDRQHMIAAFDGEDPIGSAQDEWGCVLVQVAQEYRGRGIGTELGHIYRSIYGGKSSGGLTQAGYENLFRIHRRMVTDAVRYGKYERAGVPTSRVAQIVKSTERIPASWADEIFVEAAASRPDKPWRRVLDFDANARLWCATINDQKMAVHHYPDRPDSVTWWCVSQQVPKFNHNCTDVEQAKRAAEAWAASQPDPDTLQDLPLPESLSTLLEGGFKTLCTWRRCSRNTGARCICSGSDR